MGCGIAYYLAKKGRKPLVVEATDIASGASGKAGGFLALDWCDTSPLKDLARASFALHAGLSAELDTDIGYRKVNTTAATNQKRTLSAMAKTQHGSSLPAWLDGRVAPGSSMGTVDTTAQVHPYLLTSAFMKRAIEQGAQFRKGTVQSCTVTDGRITGVVVDGDIIPADIVIIAMGPWTGLASQWFSIPEITSLKAHSIVLQPANPVTADAIFLAYESKDGTLDPEIYPRPDGTVYLCGVSATVNTPASSRDVVPTDGACETLVEIASSVSKCLAEAPVKIKQACLLPISPDDVPLIGAIPDVQGAFICSGHSCWGILNAPASALALAELVVDGAAKIVDLSPFSPARFNATNEKRGRRQPGH